MDSPCKCQNTSVNPKLVLTKETVPLPIPPRFAITSGESSQPTASPSRLSTGRRTHPASACPEPSRPPSLAHEKFYNFFFLNQKFFLLINFLPFLYFHLVTRFQCSVRLFQLHLLSYIKQSRWVSTFIGSSLLV